MKILKKITFVFFLFFITGNLFSQEVRVDAVLDTSKLRIGEQAKIDIYVTYSSKQKDIKIEWPGIGDTLTEKIEVISKNAIDTTLPDKTNSSKIFQHQQILVSVYDSGYYAIPGFKFILNNDTAHPLFTDPLFLEVHTVPTDTSAKNLKDIKAPFNEPFNWKWYLDYIYWGSAILVLIIALIIIRNYYARKNKQVIIEPEKPKIPAHITALAFLNKIKEEQIWKEGKVKEYYSSISETIRAYIEGRFNVHALESTTDEIMSAFRSQVVDKESKDKLQQLLTLSDLVKFAKMFPLEDEHNFTLQNAFDFVEGTKREEEMSEQQQAEMTAEAQKQASENVTNQFVSPITGEIKSNTASSGPNAELKTLVLNKPQNIQLTDRQKNINKIVAGIVGIVVIGVVVWRVFFVTPQDKTMDVSVAVVAMNQFCPTMIDPETRLDNVTAVSDDRIQFNYTLVNVMADQIDVAAMEAQMENVLLQQVQTNPQMEIFRKANATLIFSFKDKAGNFFLAVKIQPEAYNNIN